MIFQKLNAVTLYHENGNDVLKAVMIQIKILPGYFLITFVRSTGDPTEKQNVLLGMKNYPLFFGAPLAS
jgi:hypothetical protein